MTRPHKGESERAYRSGTHEAPRFNAHFPSPLQMTIENTVTNSRGYEPAFLGDTPQTPEQLNYHLYQMDQETITNGNIQEFVREQNDLLPRQRSSYLSPQDQYLQNIQTEQLELLLLQKTLDKQ